MILTVSLLVLFRVVHLSHVNLGSSLLNAAQENVTRSPTFAVALFRRCFWITGFRLTGGVENTLSTSRPEKVKLKCNLRIFGITKDGFCFRE